MSTASVLWVQQQVEPLREKTVKVLREAILSSHLRPGERLVERDLCERSGVSRSSIREALRYLESEGLVESRGSRGMFVTELTRQGAMEVYEVRAALEAEAARHFAERASDEQVAGLRAAFSLVEEAAGGNGTEFGPAIDRFFEVLFDGAGNATAQAIMRTLRARINFLRNATIRLAPASRLQGSMRQMRRIMDALERRDAEAAAVACRGYVARSAEFAASRFDDLTTTPAEALPARSRRAG